MYHKLNEDNQVLRELVRASQPQRWSKLNQLECERYIYVMDIRDGDFSMSFK